MPANTDPLYALTPSVSTDGAGTMSQGVTAAAADYDGTSANYVLVFTAGPNGAVLERIRAKAKGTNVTAVARVFVNNGTGAHTTASNNTFVDELDLPATAASTTASTPAVDRAYNWKLEAGQEVYVGLGAAVAAGWVFTAFGAHY